jgi:hypothetical protein
MYTAYEFAVLTSEQIVAGIRDALYKRLFLPFTANEDDLSGRALLYSYSTILIDHIRKVNICISLIKNNTCLVASQPAPHTPDLKADVLWHG